MERYRTETTQFETQSVSVTDIHRLDTSREIGGMFSHFDGVDQLSKPDNGPQAVHPGSALPRRIRMPRRFRRVDADGAAEVAIGACSETALDGPLRVGRTMQGYHERNDFHTQSS